MKKKPTLTFLPKSLKTIFCGIGLLVFPVVGFAADVLDNFNDQLYTNNNGTASWASDWSEAGEVNSPTAGSILVTTDPTAQPTTPPDSSFQLQVGGDGTHEHNISRTANLDRKTAV